MDVEALKLTSPLLVMHAEGDRTTLRAWNFYNPKNLTEQLDVVISTDLKGKKVRSVRTAGGPVRVLARADLIAMKRASGRPQDLADIEALENLR